MEGPAIHNVFLSPFSGMPGVFPRALASQENAESAQEAGGVRPVTVALAQQQEEKCGGIFPCARAKELASETESNSNGVHISLRAEEIFHIGSFGATNSLVLSTLVFLLLAGAAFFGRKKYALVPGKLQNAAEFLIEGILGVMDSVLGDRKKSEKYLPLVGTIFLFVLSSNWLGLFPGVGSLMVRGEETAPLLRAPSADLNFTLALAVVTVVAVNVLGAAAIGTGTHLGKFFNFRNPVMFFIGILEFVSEFARMVSFSFRLFGNIFAGEVLLTIVGFLVPYFVPLPFLFLEIFVGFIQALIFSMLTLVFIGIAIAEHGEEAHAH